MYEVAFEAGYRLSVIIANDKRADYYGDCYAYRSEGIVNMSRFFCSEQNYRKFIEHEIAVVNVISGKDSFEVSLNYAPAIEAFVQDLKRKNRSRVAFIADTSKTEIEPDTRYIAMRYYAEKYGVGFEESLLRCFEENTGYAQSVRVRLQIHRGHFAKSFGRGRRILRKRLYCYGRL